MRRDARETAFKVIVSHLFSSQPEIENFYSDLKKDEDKLFAQQLVQTFLTNKEELDTIISQNLTGYEKDRIYKLDLALLYLAIAEINYINTPFQIAINEVCELAKKYSTSKSSRFINGVLSSVIKKQK